MGIKLLCIGIILMKQQDKGRKYNTFEIISSPPPPPIVNYNNRSFWKVIIQATYNLDIKHVIHFEKVSF